MQKEDYLKIAKERLTGKSQTIMLEQIDTYYKSKNYTLPKHKYKVGDYVFLEKGTLLHGTYKNIDGLKEIAQDGLISSWFIVGRGSKYPSSVGVWNLTKDYFLKDYIKFYSGGTIRYCQEDKSETEVISITDMPKIIEKVIAKGYLVWKLEQTKEARFLPSLVQNKVQIGIIFNSKNKYTKELLKKDILNPNNISDIDVKDFVNSDYYNNFIKDRINKDDFFTNRESAILFGIPANLIEGILVGVEYEKDKAILSQIKNILPNCYICNLEGKIIVK